MTNRARDAKRRPTQRSEREQMGRKVRNSVLQHELFILSKNIPNVSRAIVLDKREDRQVGWAKRGEGRKEGKDKRAPYSQKRRSGTEFPILLNSESRNRLETTFGLALLCRRGPKTSVIRLAVQISH